MPSPKFLRRRVVAKLAERLMIRTFPFVKHSGCQVISVMRWVFDSLSDKLNSLCPPSERDLWVKGSTSDTKNDSYRTRELRAYGFRSGSNTAKKFTLALVSLQTADDSAALLCRGVIVYHTVKYLTDF